MSQVFWRGPPLGAPLLLDTLSGAASLALSSRKLRTAYGGSSIKVVRSSDSALQDIGFSGTDLDTGALASFVGANNGNTSKWYDQSGNARDAFANTNQPLVVSSGTNQTINGHVALVGTAAASTLLAAGPLTFTMSQPITIAAVFKYGATKGHLFDGFGSARILLGSNAGAYQMYAGNVISGGTVDTSLHAGFAIFNGASSNLFIDGSQVITNLDVGAGAWGDGANGEEMFQGQTAPSDVTIAEVVVFNSVMSAGDRSIIRTSWQSYWGTP